MESVLALLRLLLCLVDDIFYHGFTSQDSSLSGFAPLFVRFRECLVYQWYYASSNKWLAVFPKLDLE